MHGMWANQGPGTMAGSVSNSRGTVVHVIPDLIHDSENKSTHRYEGVGNTGGAFRWMVEGATGSGTKRIIFNALRKMPPPSSYLA